jgi:hypothetical protein
MIFDVNTAIGHWPFRRLENNQADSLRSLLEEHGIGGAAVAHTHGIFYANVNDANLELADAIAPHQNFFVGVATLSPTSSNWEKDLEECVRELNFKALRLLPRYHSYSLDEPEAVEIARAAAEYDIPILVPQMISAQRQRHWMDLETLVDTAELGRLCLKVPKAKFILTEYRVAGPLTDGKGKPLYPNLYIETSRLTSAYTQGLGSLVCTLGSDHLLFGSGAPFKGIAPAIQKIAFAELPDSAKEQIAWQNALAMFKVASEN